MPVRIGGTKPGGGGRIRRQPQEHECRRSPARPLTCLACGPDEAPQPAHGAIRPGPAIISGAGDHGNGNQRRDPPPLPPAMELMQIILTHQPDETPAWIAADEGAEGVDRVARAKLPLDGGDANGKPSCHFPGRGDARFERCHLRRLLERIAGRNEPPDLIKAKRADRMNADPAMPAMRRVEGAAQEAGEGHAERIAWRRRGANAIDAWARI